MSEQVKWCRDCDKLTMHKNGLCVKQHQKKFVFPTEVK